MAATRAQKLKLAIFLLGSGIPLIILIAAFVGPSKWRDVDHYYVLVPRSVEGLERGAAVKIFGVRVGSVGDFELRPDGAAGVRVTLEIESGVPVSSDAQAFLKFQGLTGLKIVDVVETSSRAPALPPGSHIPYGETSLEKLTERAEQVAERLLVLMDKADVLLTRLVVLANGLEVEQLNSSFAKADQLLGELIRTRAELGQLIQSGEGELRRTSARAAATLAKVDRLVNSARSLVVQLGGSAREVQGLVRSSGAPLRNSVYNLQEAAQSFKELGRVLSQQPSSLLFSKPPRERELP